MIIIPPLAWVTLAVIIFNGICGLVRHKIAGLVHIIISFLFSVIGFGGILLLRPNLLQGLGKNPQLMAMDSIVFEGWATKTFDRFAFFSLIALAVLLVTFGGVLFWDKRRGKVSFLTRDLTAYTVGAMAAFIIAGLWASFYTINKIFDLASYISGLSLCEAFALYLPLAVKRVLGLCDRPAGLETEQISGETAG